MASGMLKIGASVVIVLLVCAVTLENQRLGPSPELTVQIAVKTPLKESEKDRSNHELDLHPSLAPAAFDKPDVRQQFVQSLVPSSGSMPPQMAGPSATPPLKLERMMQQMLAQRATIMQRLENLEGEEFEIDEEEEEMVPVSEAESAATSIQKVRPRKIAIRGVKKK